MPSFTCILSFEEDDNVTCLTHRKGVFSVLPFVMWQMTVNWQFSVAISTFSVYSPFRKYVYEQKQKLSVAKTIGTQSKMYVGKMLVDIKTLKFARICKLLLRLLIIVLLYSSFAFEIPLKTFMSLFSASVKFKCKHVTLQCKMKIFVCTSLTSFLFQNRNV